MGAAEPSVTGLSRPMLPFSSYLWPYCRSPTISRHWKNNLKLVHKWVNSVYWHWCEQKIDNFWRATAIMDIHEIQWQSLFLLVGWSCRQDLLINSMGRVVTGQDTHKDTWAVAHDLAWKTLEVEHNKIKSSGRCLRIDLWNWAPKV